MLIQLQSEFDDILQPLGMYWFSVTWTWLSYKLKRSRSNYVKEKQVMVVRR